MISFIVFLVVLLSVYLGMHYYVFIRVSHGLMLPGVYSMLLLILFAAGSVSFFGGEIVSRKAPTVWAKPLMDFGTIWFGTLAIAFTAVLLSDLTRIFFHGQAYRFYATLSAVVLTLGLSAYSVYNVACCRTVKELRIPVKNLPPNLPEFSIVHLSDIHVHNLTSPAWLSKIVEQSNSLDPDIVVITGDLIDADICGSEELCALLAGLKSKHGVYAVTGNHEHYAGIGAFMSVAGKTNIVPLRNRQVTVADAVELVGIDDDVSVLGAKSGDAIKKAMSAAGPFDPDKPKVLLAHRPDTFDAAAKLGFNLQLSGHTHAGQIPPMDLIVKFAFKYPLGLYRQGDSYAYTTAGTGYWGPPMRLFSRSEIVKFVLVNE